MAAPRSLAQALGPLLGLALLLSLLLAQTCSVSAQALLPKQLSTIFYATTCPKAEAIVAQRVAVAIHKDPTVAAPLLRLLFHDCFVRGCDASIMLNGTRLNPAEMTAIPNKSIRGLEIIDDIKAHLEAACPGVVSCADVIALAARDAITTMGGPLVTIRLGRRDGLISKAAEVAIIPSSHANVTALIRTFNSMKLTPMDMVTLTGAHTVGRGMCTRLKARFDIQDPTMLGPYRQQLFASCGGAQFEPNVMVNMDPYTPLRFDNQYFKNVIGRQGLLTSDQNLLADPRTSPYISRYAHNQPLWFKQFRVSFQKMSEIGVILAPRGQVRRNCRRLN